jgi:hypothetical protein
MGLPPPCVVLHGRQSVTDGRERSGAEVAARILAHGDAYKRRRRSETEGPSGGDDVLRERARTAEGPCWRRGHGQRLRADPRLGGGAGRDLGGHVPVLPAAAGAVAVAAARRGGGRGARPGRGRGRRGRPGRVPDAGVLVDVAGEGRGGSRGRGSTGRVRRGAVRGVPGGIRGRRRAPADARLPARVPPGVHRPVAAPPAHVPGLPGITAAGGEGSRQHRRRRRLRIIRSIVRPGGVCDDAWAARAAKRVSLVL